MGSVQLSSSRLASFSLTPSFNHRSRTRRDHLIPFRSQTSFSRSRIRAVGTIPESGSETAAPEEPPCVNFAFVSSVLLPDGTPDVHLRTACGGQDLRNIMLDSNIDLYGPYGRPLLNCAGGGTCATCMVEMLGSGPNVNSSINFLDRLPIQLVSMGN